MIRRIAALLLGLIAPGANAEDARQALRIAGFATLAALAFPAAAAAQAINIDLGTGAGLTDRIVQLAALLTVLSLAPSIVIMTTSFVRIIVVLSLLRTALGLQQSPPNSVLISLALFLTAIIMAPTFQASYNAGIKPLLDKQMELPAAFNASAQPVKEFMLGQVNPDDLALFVNLSHTPKPARIQDLPIHVVTPAFMISELKRGFEIGFLLFVPFLVIDLVVASVLMSMGMMMLPPVVVSLPFKLIFFVLVDGWRLVAGSLVQSFQHGPGGLSAVRVLLIKGESAYNASRAFIDDLALAFRRGDCEAIVIDGLAGEVGGQVDRERARAPFDLVYTINVGGDWRDGLGRTLSQRAGAPHVLQFVDYPLTHFERLDKTAPNTALLVLDRNHVAAVRSVYGPDHFAHVGFSPAGAAGRIVPIEPDPDAFAAARPISILFPGTYQAPPADPWVGLPDGVKTLLGAAAERQLADEASTALDALDKTMVAVGLDPMNSEVSAFRKLASHVNEYVRFRRRAQFLDAAAAVGLPLHVYGGGYAEHLGRLPNITYLGEADLSVVQAEMRRARVVMNINANFYGGAHDRPFTAGAAGAATASDFSDYLAEQFEDGRSIQFFHWSNIEAGLEAIGRLANDPERVWAMAKAGQARVSQAHLWDHRIAAIRETAAAVRQLAARRPAWEPC